MLAGALLLAAGARAQDDSFQSAVNLVKQHSQVIVLSDGNSGATIAVWPALQGRVLTSSVDGSQGHSFGWVNQQLIASGKPQPHIYAAGGEDRLWLGPEGGQFSIFFAQSATLDLDHWYTPAVIDTEPFDVTQQTPSSVSLRRVMDLKNHSGTHFHVQVDRQVRLLDEGNIWAHLKLSPMRKVKVVGFESDNRLTNLSPTPWSKSTGLLSLWVLGQFQSSPTATIILPIRKGAASQLGIPVTSDYFGTVPANRIAIRDNAIFFKADGKYRSKLGLSWSRAEGVLGSYDSDHHVLTVVQFSQPPQPADYVNSAWKIQEQPFKGDVANCYNDGPPAPGKPQLGSFYELESSSPAKALSSQASVQHVHRTIHLVGSQADLETVARQVLGVPLNDLPTTQAH